MSASSRGSRAAASLIRSSRHPRVCSDCIKTICQSSPIRCRPYSIAAPSPKTSEGTTEQQLVKNIPPVSSTASEYITHAGIILSRPPLLTRQQTPFEKAFFFYQKRLNERLAMPFSRYFYFKKDSPSDVDWKLKAKDRGGVAAKELGSYQAYSKTGWNDELLVGDKMSEPSEMVNALVKDSELRTIEGQKTSEIVEGIKVEQPLPRITEADIKKDYKRLDRKLERTLYLVVLREDGNWGFPSGPLIGKESLHQAAERIIVQSAGVNMNTWVVGHAPVSHFIKPFVHKTEKSSFERKGEKVFFLKGRIMAGQANIKDNLFGIKDFRWLTKDELQKRLGDKFYSAVKNSLPEC